MHVEVWLPALSASLLRMQRRQERQVSPIEPSYARLVVVFGEKAWQVRARMLWGSLDC
jgi:hypothetical protein